MDGIVDSRRQTFADGSKGMAYKTTSQPLWATKLQLAAYVKANEDKADNGYTVLATRAGGDSVYIQVRFAHLPKFMLHIVLAWCTQLYQFFTWSLISCL